MMLRCIAAAICVLGARSAEPELACLGCEEDSDVLVQTLLSAQLLDTDNLRPAIHPMPATHASDGNGGNGNIIITSRPKPGPNAKPRPAQPDWSGTLRVGLDGIVELLRMILKGADRMDILRATARIANKLVENPTRFFHPLSGTLAGASIDVLIQVVGEDEWRKHEVHKPEDPSVREIISKFKDEMFEETKGLLHDEFRVPESVKDAFVLAVKTQNLQLDVLRNEHDADLKTEHRESFERVIQMLGHASLDAMGGCRTGNLQEPKCKRWIALGGPVLSLMFMQVHWSFLIEYFTHNPTKLQEELHHLFDAYGNYVLLDMHYEFEKVRRSSFKASYYYTLTQNGKNADCHADFRDEFEDRDDGFSRRCCQHSMFSGWSELIAGGCVGCSSEWWRTTFWSGFYMSSGPSSFSHSKAILRS